MNRPTLDQIARAALLLFCALLPFELDAPLLRLGPLQLTNTELLLGSVLLLATAVWWRHGRPPLTIPRSWLILLGLFVLLALVTAVVAPDLRANALKAALRTAAGIALIPAALVLLRNRQDVTRVAMALVAGTAVAAAIGLLELANGTDFAWLQPLRAQPTVAGPFLRLAGPFDYANQAAMALEAMLPLLLALIWRAAAQRARLQLAGWLAVLVLLLEAVFLTFSRTSFATLLLVGLLLAAGLLWRPATRRLGWLWGGLAAAVVVLILLNYALSTTFRLRLSSEDDRAWYQATLRAPVALNLPAGSTTMVTVEATNRGSFVWRSDGHNPIHLGARWAVPATGRELAFQPRWRFPQPVAPGESVTLRLPLRLPPRAGNYELVWDLVHENVTWFDAKNPSARTTAVTVSGTFTPRTLNPQMVQQAAALEFEPPIPPRRVLWATALQLWRSRPWTGIGLDNFRLIYGPLVGQARWNETVHTNNWYLETLVSLGLAGALPFFAWLALLGWDIARRVLSGRVDIWSTAVAAGLLAFLIHGLLDYFMLFNSTALLFWLLAALWLIVRHTN